MTPDPRRLKDLDAAIAACALDALLGEPARAELAPDAVPEATYEDVEIERRTWAYRGR